MIKLGKMTVENFLSIGPKVEIDFGSHKGVNYIFGTNKDVDGTRNGVGKSTLVCDATLFALFGETSRKVGNKYIAHRQMPPNKETLITLSLENDNGKYYVEAGLRKGSGFFKLFKNDERGEMLNKSSIKETRRFFEREILGIDYLVAKSSFFLTSCDSSNFLTMDKKSKRVYIEAIFKLAVFGEMLKRARGDLNTLDKEIALAQDASMRLNADIKGFEVKEGEFITSINEKMAVQTAQLERLVALKPNLTAKLDKLKEVFSTLPEVPSIPVVQYTPPPPFVPPPPLPPPPPFVPPVVVVKDIPIPDRKDYSEILGKLDEAKGKVMATKAEAEGNISSYGRNVKKCENILDAVCVNCKPIISKIYDVKDPSYIDGQKELVVKCVTNLAEVEEKRRQVFELQKLDDEVVRKAEKEVLDTKRKAEDEIRDLKNKFDDEFHEREKRHDDMVAGLKREYDDKNFEIRRKAEEAILEARKKALQIESDRSKVSAAVKEVEAQIGSLDNEIKVAVDRKIELSNSENPYKKLIEEYTDRLVAKNGDLTAFHRKRKLMDVVITVVGEEGVKKHILDDIVEIVNNRVQKYLYETGSSFTCVFDGSFGCEFITETGPASYENFSSGEKARINLSILLTFRDILLTMGFPRMNVLVVDELIDSNLDSYAVNAVAGVLKRITTTENLSAYLISHRECFDDGLFEKVMEVVKQGGFTSLIEDSRRV